jgi:hypothetical protein
MVGFRKVFVRNGESFSALRAEYVDGTESILGRNRGEGDTYIHSVLRQGHTENGQLLGAAVGVGSTAGANLAWDMYSARGRSSWYLERTVENNQTSRLTPADTTGPSHPLTITLGYEQQRFTSLGSFIYSIAISEAKRDALLPKELNVNLSLVLTRTALRIH